MSRYNRPTRRRLFAGLSVYDDVEQIWEQAFREWYGVSEGLDTAIDRLQNALQRSYNPSIMADEVADVADWARDSLYENDRANFYRHFIDPIFDALDILGMRY